MTYDVITFSPEQTCRKSKRIFKQHRIRRAPVLDKNQFVGIVSERDLLHTLPGTIGGIPVIYKGKLKGIITESDIFKAMWKILSFDKGCGILIFDEGNNRNEVFSDYIELRYRSIGVLYLLISITSILHCSNLVCLNKKEISNEIRV